MGGGSEGGGVLFVFIVFVLFGCFSVKCRMHTRVQICCFLFRANGDSISASEAALKPLKMLEYPYTSTHAEGPRTHHCHPLVSMKCHPASRPTRVLLCNVDADWA